MIACSTTQVPEVRLQGVHCTLPDVSGIETNADLVLSLQEHRAVIRMCNILNGENNE